MEPNKTVIERSFELARTGLFFDVAEIRARLRDEGYLTHAITGPLLCQELKSMMETARRTRWTAGHAGVAKANRAKLRHARHSTAR
jgi:hypothetical protein